MLRKIKIEQKVFENQKTGESINKDFSEFALKKYTIDEFFDLYQQLFYEIEKKGRLSHSTIVAKSTEYAGTPPNPKDQEILDLREQVKDLQFEIDSIPEEHPFLPNDRTILQSREEPSLRYLMQSGRKRKINTDEVFNLLKERAGYTSTTPDEDFSVLLNAEAIAGIVSGPDINSPSDLNIDIATVNRFTPGANSNSLLDNIVINSPQPDLRKNPALALPEYDPVFNIEEPPVPPQGFELQPVMNSNVFNQANTPLNNYRYNSNS